MANTTRSSSRPDAVVHTEAEGEMAVRGAGEVAIVGARERLLVAVGRVGLDQDSVAGPHQLTADLDVLLGDPQQLLQRGRHQVRPVDERLPAFA